jgi:hypothetical protein
MYGSGQKKNLYGGEINMFPVSKQRLLRQRFTANEGAVMLRMRGDGLGSEFSG